MGEGLAPGTAPAPAVQCDLCPHDCRLEEYERGQCRVRINVGGRLHSLVYGRPCAVHVDPIEKKPMFHVLPGSRAFSIATAGCCLHCRFCQNWDISQANPEDVQSSDLSPAQVVQAALKSGCQSIAYTYSEPTIFFEYAYDTALLAREAGLLNVSVTSGYIKEEPLRRLCTVMDCANVDLKGFTDDFYRTVCGGRLQPVLDGLLVAKASGQFIELTNLLVPGLNDDMPTFTRMAQWIVANLGPDVPLHLSRFWPQYRMRNLEPTPASTLTEAWQRARDAGLRYVYVGNILLPGSGRTACPGCAQGLVDREGFFVTRNVLKDGACPSCGAAIPGIWAPRGGGSR